MKLVIPGGSGFIGRHLCRSLFQKGHEITALSRNPQLAQQRLDSKIQVAPWGGEAGLALEKVLEGADAVINLAGEPIADARWTEKRKHLLWRSRIDTTRQLVDALACASNKPSTLINASAIGFYGSQESKSVNEGSPAGEGFLADLCVAWEREATRAETLGIRVVRLRIGMVLGLEGGALSKMLFPFRLFLGGPIAPGSQPISWIHIDDLVNLISWILENEHINQAVNAVAPMPVTMGQFCRTLGYVLGRPSWFPVPKIVLRVALGEMATLLTSGQVVEPGVAKREGFQFKYPSLHPALEALLKGIGA
jgi:hypothetical protein